MKEAFEDHKASRLGEATAEPQRGTASATAPGDCAGARVAG